MDVLQHGHLLDKVGVVLDLEVIFSFWTSVSMLIMNLIYREKSVFEDKNTVVICRCLEVVPVDGIKNCVRPTLPILVEFTHLEGGPSVYEALKIIICDDCALDGKGGFFGCRVGGYWGGAPFSC